MTDVLIFNCEGVDHRIELEDNPGSETLRQLKSWLPAEITIHCAKIAGCHIYWPSPILAQLEKATDIHSLKPGSFLYYPDRQYLEIIYDELQAETAAVTYLGKLTGGIEWLKEFATRQRKEAGSKIFTARLSLESSEPDESGEASVVDPRLASLRTKREQVWAAEPAEVAKLLANSGHNIPLGPTATADGYFRFVQESVWQLWYRPERFSDAQKRAAAINSLELGISRIGHYCHLADSEAFLYEAIECLKANDLDAQSVYEEIIFYCSRMSNWMDLHIPWYPANEITKKILGC
jgi:hypothetical protein